MAKQLSLLEKIKLRFTSQKVKDVNKETGELELETIAAEEIQGSKVVNIPVNEKNSQEHKSLEE